MLFCVFGLDGAVLVGETGVLKNVIQGEQERQPSVCGKTSAETHNGVHGLCWTEIYFFSSLQPCECKCQSVHVLN